MDSRIVRSDCICKSCQNEDGSWFALQEHSEHLLMLPTATMKWNSRNSSKASHGVLAATKGRNSVTANHASQLSQVHDHVTRLLVIGCGKTHMVAAMRRGKINSSAAPSCIAVELADTACNCVPQHSMA